MLFSALFLVFAVFLFHGAECIGCQGQTCFTFVGKCVPGTRKCEFKTTNPSLMKKIDPAYKFEENNIDCKRGLRSCNMNVCYLAWAGKCLLDLAGTCERTYEAPLTPGSVAESDYSKFCHCEHAKPYCSLEAVNPADKKNKS